MSALDWGGGNGVNLTPRYYTFNSPALPDSDWSIGIWMRRLAVTGSNEQRLFVIGTTDTNGSAYVWLGDTLNGNMLGTDVVNAAGSTWLNETDGAALPQDSADYLTVLQRRSGTCELYVVKEGQTANIITSQAGISGNFPSFANSTIGTAPGVGDQNRNPLGDFFIFTDRSLSQAQVTALAGGNSPTTIANPAVLLQFRTGANANEPNLGTGGAINNAIQVSTGFTTTTEFYPLPSLSQTLTPNADTVTGNWVASIGSTLFSVIDETVRDDTDYALLSGVVGSTFKVALSSANDPLIATNHVVSYAIMATAGNMNVRLVQDANTTIAQWTHVPVAGAFTEFDQTLSNAQANAITNYGNLFLEFRAF